MPADLPQGTRCPPVAHTVRSACLPRSCMQVLKTASVSTYWPNDHLKLQSSLLATLTPRTACMRPAAAHKWHMHIASHPVTVHPCCIGSTWLKHHKHALCRHLETSPPHETALNSMYKTNCLKEEVYLAATCTKPNYHQKRPTTIKQRSKVHNNRTAVKVHKASTKTCVPAQGIKGRVYKASKTAHPTSAAHGRLRPRGGGVRIVLGMSVAQNGVSGRAWLHNLMCSFTLSIPLRHAIMS